MTNLLSDQLRKELSEAIGLAISDIEGRMNVEGRRTINCKIEVTEAESDETNVEYHISYKFPSTDGSYGLDGSQS